MQTNLLRLFLLVTITFSYLNKGIAKHIVGGEITYVCTGLDTMGAQVFANYDFTFTMYRDCYQEGLPESQFGPFDNPATVGIHVNSGSGWLFADLLRVSNPVITTVDPNGGECVTPPENLCVDQGIYRFSLSLEVIDQSYLISYQRCCRNNTISNIRNPGGTGAVFSTEITAEAQRVCNNSAVFNDFPPLVICEGFNFDFDHSATDSDGDQLVYEFCTPLAAGGPNTNTPLACNGTTPSPDDCRPPYAEVLFVLPTYSTTQPITGDPALSLNAANGLITGKPDLVGQYVVGICAKEFRDGVLINTLRRDFQFNVTTCSPVVQAILPSDFNIGEKEYLINSCGSNTVEFENESIREDFISTYVWEFNVDGQILSSNEREATITFPGIGEYEGVLMLNPGSNCSDTANIFVNVFPAAEADFSFDYDTCVAGPVDYLDLSSTGGEFLSAWEWDFGEGKSSEIRNPSSQFSNPGQNEVSLTVTDNNNCTAESTQVVDWFPVPQLLIVEPSSFIGCQPAEIFFNNLSSPVNEDYDIFWDFGDGNTSDEISPTHTYEEPGAYDIFLEIISPVGCGNDRSFESLIRVEEAPIADFTFTPEVLNTFNKTASFFDNSIDAVSWQWNFDNEASAFDPNPTYTFRDTGVHVIQLVVSHPSGCTDTLVKQIDVMPLVDFYMPNAFTPNNDAKNESFRGKGFVDGLTDFNMTIWDRWGEIVFETEDSTEGWNGRKFNTGANLPQGVYVYLVKYIGPRGQRKELKGFATLLR